MEAKRLIVFFFFFLSYPVIYNRSLNANNDIMKKNKARKEVAEIAGASGEYTLLV